MRQPFFISPNGFMPVTKAFEGCPRDRENRYHPRDLRTHGCAEGDNARKDAIIGIVEIHRYHSLKRVTLLLEAQGTMWLPDPRASEKIRQEHYEALRRHGVQADHITAETMRTVHEVSGFPPHLPIGSGVAPPG
jgi:hypothetical protein